MTNKRIKINGKIDLEKISEGDILEINGRKEVIKNVYNLRGKGVECAFIGEEINPRGTSIETSYMYVDGAFCCTASYPQINI